ncbi:MAG: pyrroline-5-carboxylate reductase [Leptonema sp. (in: bacteria)]
MKIGFIGFGKMAKALASGIIKQTEHFIYFYDINENLNYGDFLKTNRVKSFSSIRELEENSDVVIFSVKPQNLKEVVKHCVGYSNKYYISIAAGISLKKILNWNSKLLNIARVMPNLGAFVGKSVSGIYSDNMECKKIATEIFQSIGITIDISTEDLMHSITALSGSGPAYVFLFIQSMIEAGIRSGFSYETSYDIVLQTIYGALEILKQNKENPTEWIYKVTSPAGTTIEALAILEKNHFKYSIYEAISEAIKKSKELGE